MYMCVFLSLPIRVAFPFFFFIRVEGKAPDTWRSASYEDVC